MGLDVGGTTLRPDWPKMGPSLLIATSLILAIRTAKWPAKSAGTWSQVEIDQEVAYCARLAGTVLSYLLATKASFFPQVKEPWFVPNDDDTPK